MTVAGWVGYKDIRLGNENPGAHEFSRIAILVPAYKEDAVIKSVAKNLSLLDYPIDKFKVFVIADSMKESTVREIKQSVEVIEVSFKNSTKSKSLNYAFNSIREPFDIAVISDGDNILENDFLKLINKAYHLGYKAMQGHRVAKNTNTSVAILDAASEEINNHIFRRGANGLGLSSAIIGSGMAFDYQLLKEVMANNKAVGGFDKILQLELLERRIKIRYLDNAIAYDEKVESTNALQNQRKRWISVQLKYLTKYFFKGWVNLLKSNFSYFNIAVLGGILLPRVIFLGLLSVISLITFLFPELSYLGGLYWLILFVIYAVSMVSCIPIIVFHRSFLIALSKLPTIFFKMLLAMVGLKKADDRFIHTSHSKSSIDNIFRKKRSA